MSDYIRKKEVLDILYKTFEKYNMTTDKQDKHGGFGAEVFKRVKDIPTLDEKEIIRKAFERVVERLEEIKDWLMKDFVLANKAEMVKKDALSRINQLDGAIKIVKEECGISE